MSNFVWEPLDFLDALGVRPAEEEYGMAYHYTMERTPLRLELTIRPLDGDGDLAILCNGSNTPVVLFSLLDSHGARVKDVKLKFCA